MCASHLLKKYNIAGNDSNTNGAATWCSSIIKVMVNRSSSSVMKHNGSTVFFGASVFSVYMATTSVIYVVYVRSMKKVKFKAFQFKRLTHTNTSSYGSSINIQQQKNGIKQQGVHVCISVYMASGRSKCSQAEMVNEQLYMVSHLLVWKNT